MYGKFIGCFYGDCSRIIHRVPLVKLQNSHGLSNDALEEYDCMLEVEERDVVKDNEKMRERERERNMKGEEVREKVVTNRNAMKYTMRYITKSTNKYTHTCHTRYKYPI